MPVKLSIHDILAHNALIQKLYDMARVVDPMRKLVYECTDQNASSEYENCHQLWGRDISCDNCVSARAFNENQTFIKLDYTGGKVLMVTAIPFDTEDGRVVLELLRDVTTTGIIDDGDESMEIAKLISLRNEKIIKDTLVNCYNKRYITERLPYEIVDAVVKKSSLAVIMADIDWFRVVNNTYGHQTGDHILKGFVDCVAGCLTNERDWIARYGGEEFLICLHGLDEHQAWLKAEEMRIKLAETSFGVSGHAIRVTASFGVVCMENLEATDEELIRAADENLYKAKGSGRNKVVASTH